MPTDNDGNSGTTPTVRPRPSPRPVPRAATNPDPLGWGAIAAAEQQRKTLYDAADAQNGWAPGTAASNNGEPGLGGSSLPAAGAAPTSPYAPSNAIPGGGGQLDVGTPYTIDNGVVTYGPDGTAAAPAGPSKEQKDVFASLKANLDESGLGALYTLDASGNPSGWLWDQITNGNADSPATLGIAIEGTPQWQAEYKPILDIRHAKASGQAVTVPTMVDVRNYRTSVRETMKSAGLPAWFYTGNNQIDQLMVNGFSGPQIEKRLGTAFSRVMDTDPSIRAAYTEFYGIGQGDAALAATFLDPVHTEAQLEKASMAAYTAGKGRNMGINVDRVMAERIAGLPKTEGGIIQDFQEVNRLGAVFTEGITENQDLTAESTGLASVALGDAQATADIERRVLQRQSNARATVGGALQTNQGLTGLGSTSNR